jgi:hypothetical protein
MHVGNSVSIYVGSSCYLLDDAHGRSSTNDVTAYAGDTHGGITAGNAFAVWQVPFKYMEALFETHCLRQKIVRGDARCNCRGHRRGQFLQA